MGKVREKLHLDYDEGVGGGGGRRNPYTTVQGFLLPVYILNVTS